MTVNSPTKDVFSDIWIEEKEVYLELAAVEQIL